MTDQSDERSPLAVAAVWVSQVTTVAFEMALPALAGHWIDGWLGTGAICLMLGSALGLATGMWHLLRLVAKANADTAVPGERRDPHDPGRHDDRSEEF